MASISTQSLISVPFSLIKSPGMLLKDKKEVLDIKKAQIQIQGLLEAFKDKTEAPLRSLKSVDPLTAEKLHFQKRAKTCLDSFGTSTPIDDVVSPGKLKNLIDTTSTQMKLSKEIFTIYGVELVVENSNISREACTVLKTVIPEVCFFPPDFFNKIKIKEFSIRRAEKKLDSSADKDTSFTVVLHDTHEKVCHRLYGIIFAHIIAENPRLLEKLKEIEPTSQNEKQEDYIKKLEDHFVALMVNTNHAFLKPNAKKLGELLAICYPGAMSAERFKNRYKEKKKSLKVRFETDPL